MKVYDLMSEQVISVGVSEPVSAAARLMKQYNIGAVPVCDSAGKLRGMITDRDITVRCTALGAAPDAMKVGEVMTRGAVTIDERRSRKAHGGRKDTPLAGVPQRGDGRYAQPRRSCPKHRLRHRSGGGFK